MTGFIRSFAAQRRRETSCAPFAVGNALRPVPHGPCASGAQRPGGTPRRAFPTTRTRTLRRQPQLPRGPAHRRDAELDVLVEVHPQVRRPGDDVLAPDRRRERRLLHLLADAFRRQPLQPVRADQCAGRDEPAQLVAGVERLVQARDARRLVGEVIRVGLDRVDHLLRVAALPEDRRAAQRVVRRVRPALVIEVVQQADRPPQFLVLPPDPRVGPHRRLDGEHVLDEAVTLRVLPHEGEVGISIHLAILRRRNEHCGALPPHHNCVSRGWRLPCEFRD